MLPILFKNNFFLLIILSSIWGSAFLGIKIAVDSISPISVVSFRLIIGAIILLIYFKMKGNHFNFSIKTYFYIFLCALFGNFIPFYLISWSELFIPSNLAGLLLSVAPIFAIVLSHIFTNDDKLAERMRKMVNHGMEDRYHYKYIGVNSRSLDLIFNNHARS